MRNPYLLLPILAGALSVAVPAFAITTAPSAASIPALHTLVPPPREALVDQAITNKLMQENYAKRPFDQQFAESVFDHFIKDLDPERSCFLQSDIDGFAAYRAGMQDTIHNGDPQPAFDIYNIYIKRLEERYQYALKSLEHEPDFTVKESFVFDRQKAAWPQNTAELDDLWRKRVKSDAIGLMLTGKSWQQSADILRKRYQNYDYRLRQITETDAFTEYMNALARAIDPHTYYLSPSQTSEFRIRLSLNLQGIGATLVTEGEYTRVDSIIPGGPAARDKRLHPNDRVTAVGQGDNGELVDVVGWRLDDVVALIRGKPGSIVRLQILPSGASPDAAETVLQLTRDNVKLEEAAARQKIVTVNRGGHAYKIGVVTVPSFYEDFGARRAHDQNFTSTTRDVHRLLDELKAAHVDGVVMDLRNNPGGSLEEAKGLTGLFIPQGPVVQIRQQNGHISVEDDAMGLDDDGVAYSGPLTVLVNRSTASASEIFAGAIQDYHRGLVVGATTYGKGTVQYPYDLDPKMAGPGDAGELWLTVNKFYRVTGSSTQTRGVTPDITLPGYLDPADFGESSNDTALPWDEISPAEFAVLHLGLEGALPKLAQEHSQRVTKDPAWHLYMDALHDYQQQRAKTSISLVLSEREQQRTEDDKQRLLLLNGWRKLKDLPPVASLDQANQSASKPASASTAAKAADTEGSDSAGVDTSSIEPDVLLDETTQIATDLASLAAKPPTAASAVADRH